MLGSCVLVTGYWDAVYAMHRSLTKYFLFYYKVLIVLSLRALFSMSIGSLLWMYSVSQKKIPPPWGLVSIFPKPLWIFQPNFTCLLCVPIYARLRIFIKLPATLTKLCHIKRNTPSSHHVRNMSTISQNAFSDIFPKRLGIFSLNFTCLLNIYIYARMQIFVQLSPTVTKLCHIKFDHPVCVSVVGGHSHYGGRA